MQTYPTKQMYLHFLYVIFEKPIDRVEVLYFVCLVQSAMMKMMCQHSNHIELCETICAAYKLNSYFELNYNFQTQQKVQTSKTLSNLYFHTICIWSLYTIFNKNKLLRKLIVNNVEPLSCLFYFIKKIYYSELTILPNKSKESLSFLGFSSLLSSFLRKTSRSASLKN